MSALSEAKSDLKDSQADLKDARATVKEQATTTKDLSALVGELGDALSMDKKAGEDSIAFLHEILTHVKAHHGNTPGL